MRVTVKLFARLRDLAGAGELVREVEAPATVETVWKTLTAEMPSLLQYERTMSVAVNAEYAKMAAAVRDGDEVAFLPPVSGGCEPAEARRTTEVGPASTASGA